MAIKLRIAYQSRITVDGAGSSLNISGSLQMIYNGSAELLISNGGQVTANSIGLLGANSTATLNNGHLITNGFRIARSKLNGTGTVALNGLQEWDEYDGYGVFVFDTIDSNVANTVTDTANGNNISITMTGNGTAELGTDATLQDGADVSFSNIRLGSDNADTDELTVTGNGSTLTATVTTWIGQTGTGTLEVLDGAVFNSERSATIGSNIRQGQLSVGTATVDNATWNVSDDLTVGRQGDGTLDITNGGKVLVNGTTVLGEISGGIGEINISGADSKLVTTLLEDGNGTQSGNSGFSGGAAEINITEGGLLQVTQTGSFAVLGTRLGGKQGEGETTSVLVDGAGSRFEVNNSGGVLAPIATGGENDFVDTHIGVLGNGSVLVDGAGSTFDAGSNASIGKNKEGTLTVQNGASYIADGTVRVGAEEGSTGTGTIRGAGTTLSTTGDVFVGESGNGTLTVSDGATVNATGSGSDFNIGNDGGHGIVTLDNATINVSNNDFRVAHDGSGEFTARNGASVTAGDLVNIGHANGDVGVATFENGSTFTVGGELLLGNAGHGTLNINSGSTVTVGGFTHVGDQTNGTGILNVDGAGTTLTSTDKIRLGRTYGGVGELNITNGAVVTTLEDFTGAPGNSASSKVLIAGEGSKLVASKEIRVSWDNDGTMTVKEGGQAIAGGDFVIEENSRATGVLNIGVSRNDMVIAGSDGSGVFYNRTGGTVNLFATPELTPGEAYTPISAASGFTGGGTWDDANHTFTASPIIEAAYGVGEGSINNTVVTGARYSYNGGTLIVGFSEFETNPASFAVSRSDFVDLDAVSADIAADINGLDSIYALTGYDFYRTNQGISPDIDEAVTLSFILDEGTDMETLSIFHRPTGGDWEIFTDYSFIEINGTVLTFTTDSFSSYAVGSSVPEPTSAGLLLAALALAAARRRAATATRG